MRRVRRLLKLLLLGRPDGLRSRVRRRMRRRGEHPAPTMQPGSPPPADPIPPADAIPDGYTAALSVGELHDGAVVEVIIDGVTVALARVEGAFHAIASVCPHAGGPLGEGSLEGCTLTCPWHGWSYDVRDGSCFVSDEVSVRTYPVVVVGGTVCVDVRDARAEVLP